MIQSLGIALGVLFQGAIGGIVILVFLSNWQGAAGLGITLLFSALAFKACFSAAREHPRLWMLWGLLSGLMPLMVIGMWLFEKTVGFYVGAGVITMLIAGFLGSFVGQIRGA